MCVPWESNPGPFAQIKGAQRRTNNCPQLFSANSSLRVFSKPWQYYFNAKRQLSLVQAIIWPYIYYTEVQLHNETKLA